MEIRTVRKITHVLLGITTVLFILSGYGITQYQIVEKLTLGLLTKPIAFKMHSVLVIPFVLLVLFHILYPFNRWFRPKVKKNIKKATKK